MNILSTLKSQFNNLSIGRKILLVGFLLFFGISLIPTDAKRDTKEHNVKTENVTETIPNQDISLPATAYEVLSVTDGDTLRIMYEGESTPLRLIGIDTPEINASDEPVQCYGNEAKEYLESLLLGKEVYLEKDVTDRDKYDRLLRYIIIDGVIINELLVKEGYAFSSSYPPDTKYQSKIDSAEIYAKGEQKGLWAFDTCNGDVYTGTYLDPNVNPPKPESAPEPVETAPVYSPPEETYVPVAPVQTAPSYSCNCKKTCSQMSSCAEAQYQLNSCGCSARDGDKDGIACDSDCQ